MPGHTVYFLSVVSCGKSNLQGQKISKIPSILSKLNLSEHLKTNLSTGLISSAKLFIFYCTFTLPEFQQCKIMDYHSAAVDQVMIVTFRQTGTAPSGLAQNSRASSTDNNSLRMRKHSCDFVTACK